MGNTIYQLSVKVVKLPMNPQNDKKQITNLTFVLIAIFILIIAVMCLWLSETMDFFKENSVWKLVIQNFSGALISTSVLSVAIDLFAKRSFLEEVRSIAEIARTAYQTGLVLITRDFGKEINWENELEKTDQLDILVTYARTWRNNHREALTQLARRDASIRVVLPNPNNQALLEQLATRFSLQPIVLKQLIVDAEKDFNSIFSKSDNYSIWFTDTALVFSMYRFRKTRILATFAHGPKGSGVPTLVIGENGSIASFIDQQFDYFFEGGAVVKQKTAIPKNEFI